MTFTAELKRKEWTLIASRVRFMFVFDVLTEKFEGGHVAITLLSADRTEKDNKDVPISKFNFTIGEQEALGDLLKEKIDLMLAETDLVVDTTVDRGPRGPRGPLTK